MRKHCRSRVRSRGKLHLTPATKMVSLFAYMQAGLDWKEWRFWTVSLKKALELVQAGDAIAVHRMKDGVAQVVGYRALRPVRMERPSPATLTHSTMQAVSKRWQATPELQAEQMSKSERLHVEKFLAWPLIGDTKAVAVRPRISDADRRAAEAMMRSGGLARAA